MRRAFAPLLLLALTPTALLCQELKPDPVVERLRRCSVTVSTDGGSGSGFTLVRGDKAYVLTAAHVVEDLRRETYDESGKNRKVSWEDCRVIRKTIHDGRVVGEVSFDAEVVRYSAKEDIALLRVRGKNAFTEGLDLYGGKELPPIGTRVYHVGSPLGDIGSQSVIPGFYSAYGRIVEKQVLDLLSCNIFPGSSGGAITLEDGRVVGQVVRGAVGGFALIVPVRTCRDWSKRSQSEWLFDKDSAPGKEFDEGKIEDRD